MTTTPNRESENQKMRVIVDWTTELLFTRNVTRLSIFGDDKPGTLAGRVNDSNSIENTTPTPNSLSLTAVLVITQPSN